MTYQTVNARLSEARARSLLPPLRIPPSPGRLTNGRSRHTRIALACLKRAAVGVTIIVPAQLRASESTAEDFSSGDGVNSACLVWPTKHSRSPSNVVTIASALDAWRNCSVSSPKP